MAQGKQQSLPLFMNQFLLAYEQKGRQPSTIKRYYYDLEEFVQWMQAAHNNVSFEKWSSFHADDFSNYYSYLIHERNYSERTMKRISTVLKQLFRFYEEKGHELVRPELTLETNKKASPLSEEDFMNAKEREQFLATISSSEGLSDNQLKSRHLLNDRNKSIILMLCDEGLTLHELVSLSMNDIHFESNTIDVPSITSVARTITISHENKQQYFSYYKAIPEPVRPKYHSDEPFFLAFDFQRNTYRWMYEIDEPKRVTEIAVQKMIRTEGKRAGLRKGLSAQHMRNSAILRAIESGDTKEVIQERFGFKATISLNRYFAYAENREKSSLIS
jgi:site-specific recombinase XerD